jgi:hypothetical protein
MEDNELLNAQVQARRMYNLLSEVLDISGQLSEAVDRDDQVSIRMLLNMRMEPLEKLQHARRKLEIQCDALPEEDGLRLASLLNGSPAQSQAEEGLVAQMNSNTRLLRQLVEMDERINRKLTRGRSFYTSERKANNAAAR